MPQPIKAKVTCFFLNVASGRRVPFLYYIIIHLEVN